MIEKEYMFKQKQENIPEIPEDELRFVFSRSSGHGGQNVNKVETKVTLFWNVWNSKVLTPEQKEKIISQNQQKIDKNGNLIIYAQSERSQFQNKQEAIAKLQNLVKQSLIPEKERIPTKTPKSVKEKRLQEKKKQSEKKKLRQRADYSD